MWPPNGHLMVPKLNDCLFAQQIGCMRCACICITTKGKRRYIWLLCWISDESLQEELKALRHCQPNCYCCGCLMELRLQNYFIGELWDIWDIYLKKKKPPANYTACPLFLNPVLACSSNWVLTLACSYRRKAWELPAAGFCPVSTNQHPPSFHHHRRRW